MSRRESNQQAPQAPSSGTPSALEIYSWKDYYLIIRERFLLGACAAILVTGLVGYFMLSQPPVYRSEASLMVYGQKERVLDIEEVVQTGLDGRMWHVALENHVNQLRSRSFRGYVAESLTEEEKEVLLNAYRYDEELPSISYLLRQISIESVPNSFILNVKASHRDSDAAALIANRYVERYVEFNRERVQSGNESAITFLKDQERELREKLDQTEQKLQDYRRQHNLVAVQENLDIVAQRLATVDQRLTEARMTRIQLEGQLRQVERFEAEGRNLLELFNISSLGSTPQAMAELDRLRQEREVMSQRYGRQHPEMVANQRSIEAAERLIQDNIQLAIADLRNQLASAVEHEVDLRAELKALEEESLELDRLKVQFTALQRSAAATRSTHAQVLDRLDETTIASQLESSNVRIFDFASASSSPSEPNLKRIGMLVIFLGGFFFFGTPIGLAILDSKLKNARDVEDYLEEKLIGEISSVDNLKRKFRPHVVEQGSDDRAAEGFRGLFSQLQLTSKRPYPKAIMVSSTIPGEGKSFVVNNLAHCFAAHGKRTLMIDFDLRRPSLHRFYSRLNNSGLISWLEEAEGLPKEADIEEALGIAEVAPKLFLMSSGGQTKKATEAINHPSVTALIKALRKKFDVVIIDTPPLGIFPDALPLSKLADESLYVVHFGMVDRQQVKNSIKRLKESKANLAGVVMNGMPRGARFAHYYSGYGFGNYKYSKYYSKRN